MTQRVIKFRRAYFNYDGSFYGFKAWGPNIEGGDGFISPSYIHGCKSGPDQQFSGLTDKHGKEIYEGDIRKEMFDGIFNGDPQREHYFVMVYIQEWTMFAWLSINSGEYHEYLNDGAEALDTEMYWTYPAGQDEPNKIELVGNIYTTPELVDPKMIEHGNS